MNQLFYNIAGGIEHQIRREKRTTMSEVIVHFESSSFTLNNFKTEKFKLNFEG